MAKTSIQRTIDQQGAIYDHLPVTLLTQLALIHGLTVRDFAAIFEISKSHAAEVLAHRKFPDLWLAFRISRYFECTMDEMFAWRLRDDGARRPLVIEWGRNNLVRLKEGVKADTALELVRAMADYFKEQRDLSRD